MHLKTFIVCHLWNHLRVNTCARILALGGELKGWLRRHLCLLEQGPDERAGRGAQGMTLVVQSPPLPSRALQT